MQINTRKNSLRLLGLILGLGLLLQPAYAGGHKSTVKKLKAKISEQQDNIDLLTMKLKNCQGNQSGEAISYEQVQEKSLMQYSQEQSLLQYNTVPIQHHGPDELFQWP